MKRRFALGLIVPALLAMVALVGGCPIYDDGNNCYRDGMGACVSSSSCRSSYDCPNGYLCQSGYCAPPSAPSGSQSCSSPSDCATGQNCGTDDRCHTGDCSASGCPSGYSCTLANQKVSCVSNGGTDGGTFSGCHADTDCTTLGAGSKCLSGTCTKPADQCSDGTQCRAGQCVQGACTPSCDANKACPTGYSCDTGKGVCTGNTTPCGASGTCSNGTTCVQDHCVDACGAGGACSSGLVCVDGGCMPDQRPVFTCDVEGVKDRCADGSLCLHHSCYIACSADGGTNACVGADKFNVCKSVSTGSGSYSVCGSNDNLGTDCDVTQGKNCASPLICIDGFCR